MNLSDVISKLQKFYEEHGDIEFFSIGLDGSEYCVQDLILDECYGVKCISTYYMKRVEDENF